jgi:hypothetical protein
MTTGKPTKRKTFTKGQYEILRPSQNPYSELQWHKQCLLGVLRPFLKNTQTAPLTTIRRKLFLAYYRYFESKKFWEERIAYLP